MKRQWVTVMFAALVALMPDDCTVWTVSPCMVIKGTSAAVSTTNLVFTNNRVVGAISPTDGTAECIEVRYLTDSTISNNIFVNGTLGLSAVVCNNITASANSCFNCIKALELASSSYCTLDSNVVDGNGLAGSQGILIDGGTPNPTSSYNTISNNNVSNVALSCIQVYIDSTNNNIIGGVLEQANHGQACINVDQAQLTLISGVMMRGLTTGSYGVQLINGASLTTGTVISGCMFMDFNSVAINVFATVGTAITGLRFMNNTSNGTMYSTIGATVSGPYFYGNSPEVIGSKIVLATGTNASAGTATLAAGTVTVANTLVTANSLILLSVFTAGGTRGFLSYTKTAGTSFTINSSSATETSVVAWVIVN